MLMNAVVRCTSQARVRRKLKAMGERLDQCRLRLNLQKTAIVYWKHGDRRQVHAHKRPTFLGYTFRSRRAKNRYGKLFGRFLPAVRGSLLEAGGESPRPTNRHSSCGGSVDCSVARRPGYGRVRNPTDSTAVYGIGFCGEQGFFD